MNEQEGYPIIGISVFMFSPVTCPYSYPESIKVEVDYGLTTTHSRISKPRAPCWM